VTGPRAARLRIGYAYPVVRLGVVQGDSRAFGTAALNDVTGGLGSGDEPLVIVWRTWQTTVENADARELFGLGGWSLDVHHVLDPVSETIYRGDGSEQRSVALGPVITTWAGSGEECECEQWGHCPDCNPDVPALQAAFTSLKGMEVSGEGSVLVADCGAHAVWEVYESAGPDGTIERRVRRVVGDGRLARDADWGDVEEDALATQVSLKCPKDVALGVDGSLYVLDRFLVWQVLPGEGERHIRRVTAVRQPYEWEEPCDAPGTASCTVLGAARTLAAGPEGDLYVARYANDGRVTRIAPPAGPESTVTRFVGGDGPDGGPAAEAATYRPLDVEVGPDGSVYLSQWGDGAIRRVDPDGVITTVALLSDHPGHPANEAWFPGFLALLPDGRTYVSVWEEGRHDSSHRAVLLGTDGTFKTGNDIGAGPQCRDAAQCLDGDAGSRALLSHPEGVAAGPDGSIYVAEGWGGRRIRRVLSLLPEPFEDGFASPSSDGSEVYVFDARGRHLETRDGLTGALRRRFGPADGLPTSIEDGDGNVTQIVREAGEVRFVAPHGQTTTLRLDEHGYLAEVEDPLGRTHVFGYDEQAGGGPAEGEPRGMLTSMATPAGHLYTFAYDDLGRLVVDQDPVVRAHNEATGDDLRFLALSSESRVERGREVQEVTQDNALGEQTVYHTSRYASGASVRTVTLPDGRQSMATSWPNGTSILEQSDGTRVEQTQGRDPRWGIRVPHRTSTKVQLPATEGAAALTVTRESEVEAEYGEAAAGPWGVERLTERSWVNRDEVEEPRVVRETLRAADGASVSWVLRTTTAEGREHVVTLDERGRMRTGRAGDGPATELRYDAAGRLSEVRECVGGALEDVATAAGEPVPVEWCPDEAAALRRTALSYDDQGWLWRIERRGSGPDPLVRVTELAHDAAGRPTGLTLPGGAIVTVGYDADDNLETLTPPGRLAHGFSSTPVGLPESYDPPVEGDGPGQTGYDHDLARRRTGELRQRPDGDGDPPPLSGRIVYGYDDGGRLETVTVSDSAYDGMTAYGYDAAGRLASISTPEGQHLDFTYQGRLPRSMAWSGAVSAAVTWGYDGELRRSQVGLTLGEVPEPPVAYARDGDGLPVSAWLDVDEDGECGAAEPALTMVRSAESGRLEGTALAELATTYEHAPFGELEEIETSGADYGFRLEYAHDGLGRVEEVREHAWEPGPPGGGEGRWHQVEARRYRYDEAGRLGQVQEPCEPLGEEGCEAGWRPLETYGYDANGNRTHLAAGPVPEGGLPVAATYDVQDRLTCSGSADEACAGGTRYEWTSNGELARRIGPDGAVTSYAYDVFGNLRRVELPDGQIIDYLVDGLHRRVAKVVAGQPVKGWLYGDQLNPVAELDCVQAGEESGECAAWALTARFAYASRQHVPDLMLKDGRVLRLVSDHLGSVRQVVDADQGEVVQALRYDAWGRTTVEQGEADFQPFGFAGGLWDLDTGLVRFGARDYDPEVGRWTAKDPIRFTGGDTSLFAYAANDPVNLLDLWGLAAIEFVRERGLLRVDPERAGANPYEVPANSGIDHCMNEPHCDDRPNEGPIPGGDWQIDMGDLSNPGAIRDFMRSFFGDWGDWRVPLRPMPGTDTKGRSDFFLHPGKKPGTAGCVEVDPAMADRLLRDMLADTDGYVDLSVY